MQLSTFDRFTSSRWAAGKQEGSCTRLTLSSHTAAAAAAAVADAAACPAAVKVDHLKDDRDIRKSLGVTASLPIDSSTKIWKLGLAWCLRSVGGRRIPSSRLPWVTDQIKGQLNRRLCVLK